MSRRMTERTHDDGASHASSAHAIATGDAPHAIGPYSQAIATGEFIFLSGQIGLVPETGLLIEGSVADETRRVLDNLRAVLAAAGLGLQHVVRTTVYVVDLTDFAVMNQTYAEFFDVPFPARATVQVAALPRGARIEIDAIAARPKT
jgi:2-iminobutanoate/2-iminopropanoate deaminase